MLESPNHPDTWALEAAQLPLAFAQVREDPRLDVEAAAMLPEAATVIMIASGGETLVELARLPQIERIHAVDMNPAQIALSRLKCRLAGIVSADDSCQLLGHAFMPPDQRAGAMSEQLDALELPETIFGPPDFVAQHGADHCGKYERCFAELRRVLNLTKEGMIGEEGLDDSLARVMSLANLVALFGHEATQNPARPFHEHFAWRTRVALARDDARVNPFLWQMYRGVFASGIRYDWLHSSATPRAEIHWHQGRMREVLDGMTAASADLVQLSNILDWLDVESAQATLASARRVLRPGGRVIIRQLNSSLDIASLGEALMWHEEIGAEMERRDRSFFYPRIHLGTLA